MIKRIITSTVICLLPFIASAQNGTKVQTTSDAIVCSEFRDASRLEKAITNYDVAGLMKLMESGKCWEVGVRTFTAFDYDPKSHVQHIQISRTAGGALLTMFIK